MHAYFRLESLTLYNTFGRLPDDHQSVISDASMALLPHLERLRHLEISGDIVSPGAYSRMW